MNLIIWLVVGGIVNWLASIIMHTNAQQGILMNIVVGIVGAIVGGYIVAPFVGGATINQGDFSLSGFVVSLIGAVVLLGIVNLFRRGEVR